MIDFIRKVVQFLSVWVPFCVLRVRTGLNGYICGHREGVGELDLLPTTQLKTLHSDLSEERADLILIYHRRRSSSPRLGLCIPRLCCVCYASAFMSLS